MEQLSRTGIVDSVTAKRRKNEVVYLEALIRFDTGYRSEHVYNDDLRIDKTSITFNPLSGINPGDLVQFDMIVQSPLTQRFAPALEVGSDEDEEE